MEEVWKQINSYEGCYEISSLGRVKSIPRINSYGERVPGRILSPGVKKNGYLFVNLWKNGENHAHYVHRLVASAFLPNPLNLPEVNHKDENKQNNNVSNLEWCTDSYNKVYGTFRERSRLTLIRNGNNRAIDKYDMKGNLIKSYICSNDLNKDGIDRRCALNCCYHRARSYNGFVFRFRGESFSYRKDAKKHFAVKVDKKDLCGNVVKSYNSVRQAEKDNGFSRNYLYSSTYAWTKPFIKGGYIYERRNNND